MCGIFGIFDFKQSRFFGDTGVCETLQRLKHRGPDNQNSYIDQHIILGHTRLSLVDLNPRSNQPFCDPSKNYCLVYNGEIYNYLAIRKQLEMCGIGFNTTSDTEVLLHSLIHFGIEKTLQTIEGMYAFAFYNRIEQSLILARDKFGIKPLFYTESDGAFLFASEIQGMQPWIPLKPDPFSISAYLSNGNGPTTGATFYENIQCLSPGTMIIRRAGSKPDIKRYFCLSSLWDPNLRDHYSHIKTNQVIDCIDEALSGSVRLMLAADAPVGALCSGGLDSSLITAMAKKYHNNLAIFHADVNGTYSEYPAAKVLARHLKLDLQKVDVIDSDFLRYMPEVICHYGYPFSYHPNSIPFLLVSKLVRNNGVKAVLSGEGADECFHGYPWLLFDILGVLKNFYRCPIKTIRAWLQSLHKNTLRPLIPEQALQRLYGRFEKEMEEETIQKSLFESFPVSVNSKDFISFQQLGYHLRTLLHRNDCLGMAASIEARFPFLDSELVKMAINLPYRYKVHFSVRNTNTSHLFLIDKWVLRKVASRYIPPVLYHRKKMGFPVDTFQRMEIPHAYFYDSWIQDYFGLSKENTQYLFSHCTRKLKIRLLHLEVWGKLTFLSEKKEKIAQELLQSIKISHP